MSVSVCNENFIKYFIYDTNVENKAYNCIKNDTKPFGFIVIKDKECSRSPC
jgi:hypothetical protein